MKECVNGWLVNDYSLTRLGDLVKLLATIFCYKISPNIWWHFGLFWKTLLLFKQQVLWLFFGQILVTVGLIFNPTSGHTVCERKSSKWVWLKCGERSYFLFSSVFLQWNFINYFYSVKFFSLKVCTFITLCESTCISSILPFPSNFPLWYFL